MRASAGGFASIGGWICERRQNHLQVRSSATDVDAPNTESSCWKGQSNTIKRVDLPGIYTSYATTRKNPYDCLHQCRCESQDRGHRVREDKDFKMGFESEVGGSRGDTDGRSEDGDAITLVCIHLSTLTCPRFAPYPLGAVFVCLY